MNVSGINARRDVKFQGLRLSSSSKQPCAHEKGKWNEEQGKASESTQDKCSKPLWDWNWLDRLDRLDGWGLGRLGRLDGRKITDWSVVEGYAPSPWVIVWLFIVDIKYDFPTRGGIEEFVCAALVPSVANLANEGVFP
jgi:hypothetical protein